MSQEQEIYIPRIRNRIIRTSHYYGQELVCLLQVTKYNNHIYQLLLKCFQQVPLMKTGLI